MSGTTMYLYNGVKLPELPSISDVYPYLLIFRDMNNTWYLNALASLYSLDSSGNVSYQLKGHYRWKFSTGDSSWGEPVQEQYLTISRSYVVWVNTDLFDASGNLTLAASDPIPVLPGVPYNQAFRNFLAAGIVCETLWPGISEKIAEPVASMYFYPSVVLPDIPDSIDTLKYPRLFICKHDGIEGYRLWAVDHTLISYDKDGVAVFGFGDTSVEFDAWHYFDGNTEWTHLNEGAKYFNFPMDSLVWANFDITGSYPRPATTPVPASNGMVAYKGVKLPKLPEWDRETYPHAVINTDGTKTYLTLCEKQPCIPAHDTGFVYCNNYYTYELTYNGWTYYGDGNRDMALPVNTLDWSISDVIDVDGTVFLKASDPIPVYE